jgi:hypothetical protein
MVSAGLATRSTALSDGESAKDFNTIAATSRDIQPRPTRVRSIENINHSEKFNRLDS